MQKADSPRFKKLHINEEYLKMVPRPSEIDKRRLAESLQKDGLHIPIVVNAEGIILDGHTRYEICNELGIKIKYGVKEFANKEDEIKFVVMTNLARRQLTRFQKVELAWPLYEIEKKRALERENWKSDPSLCITDKEGKIVRAKKKIKEGLAIDLFGEKIGMGHTFIHKVEWLKINASTEILDDVRTGKISTDKAYVLVKGIKLIPIGPKPEKPIKFCPQCNTETTSAVLKKCHVHQWFCCSHCGWGI